MVEPFISAMREPGIANNSEDRWRNDWTSLGTQAMIRWEVEGEGEGDAAAVRSVGWLVAVGFTGCN